MIRTIHDGMLRCDCACCRLADPTRGAPRIALGPPTPLVGTVPPPTPPRRQRSTRTTPTPIVRNNDLTDVDDVSASGGIVELLVAVLDAVGDAADDD